MLTLDVHGAAGSPQTTPSLSSRRFSRGRNLEAETRVFHVSNRWLPAVVDLVLDVCHSCFRRQSEIAKARRIRDSLWQTLGTRFLNHCVPVHDIWTYFSIFSML
ncbi:hypothetical protein FA15DRAFT_322660 [Coprinopsis marcescibilis]|uniref:Uncharacterized protein n=1 Tax=Coprinopsis marcescibilis TaxID=230819 RepID=A0A5C3KC60_COPMA|nr:hypothetical protein FA15DRAFT_322660 [Coprinopsis marcescibilis]